MIKVSDLTQRNFIDRELVLIKVRSEVSTRSEILSIVDIFRGRVVDVAPKSYTIEVTGGRDKIEGILSLLSTFGIKEIARTGKVAMARGA